MLTPVPSRKLRNLWMPAALIFTFLLVLPGSVVGQEQEPTGDAGPEVSEAEVRKVLRQLESSGLEERDAAEKQLVAMGNEILPFLPEINSRTSGEMKIRLQRIRSSLVSTGVTAFFNPTMVKLSGELSILDAVEAITEQTGNQITFQSEDALAGVEVDFGEDETETSFWVAMNKIMDQASLRVNSFGSTEGELALAPGGSSDSAPDAFIEGPFRVDVSSVQSRLPFNANLGGQLDLSLQVTWEPRLEPVFMQIPMSDVKATLSGGEELVATNPQAAPEIALNYGGCSTQVDLQIQRPGRDATSIDELSGEFVMAVPSASHQYIFKKFGNGARQSEKFGDVTVTLEGARRNGAVYEMRLLVQFGNSQGALDSFRGWILSNEAYLLDAKDARSENVGSRTYGVSANSVGIAYLFQINGNPDDYKLIYESPGAITKQTVKYQLTDIPLP